MRVRILLGPAGSGKTQRCLAEIRSRLAENAEGEPLLLLHQTGSSRQFGRLIPLLATRYRVFALDNLGAGNSDPLPPNV